MVDADTENGLLFGGRDGDREAIYARYAMGDFIDVIAADADRSVPAVYNLMREKPADYERSKQAREAFSNLRVQRASSVADGRLLKKLEAGTLNATELIRAADSLATRVRLIEGKATEIVGEEAPKTLEDLEVRMKEIRDAGDGLATG